MPYLIDGHNLIGAFPGLALSDPDDENQLLRILEQFGHATRRKVIVFFDRGQPEMGPLSRAGSHVRAHFVPPPRRADDAILEFLRGRKDARHYTVVSSDAEIRDRSRRAGAKVVSSQDFAREVRDRMRQAGKEKPPEAPEDFDLWMDIFRE
ncbi:MAG: NYN domain-containing protein [Anaerolineales bacterium]|nr:NYN domain-containing protein [Anaerolineales bacterium]